MGNTLGCGPVGAYSQGDLCGTSTTDLCAPGLVCVSVSTTVAMCLKACDTDYDCSSPGICLFTLDDGQGGSIPNATLCTPNCNPLTSAGCPTGTGCQIAQESGGQQRWLTVCDPAGTGTAYQTCTPGANDCAPKYTCIYDGFGDYCLRYYATGAGCSSIYETCYGLVDQDKMPITIGGVTLGVCDI